jgi:hypothetical protein
MKYEMQGAALMIEPTTREEQALIDILEKREVYLSGCGVKNAGGSWDSGRRTYLMIGFREKPSSCPSLPSVQKSE